MPVTWQIEDLGYARRLYVRCPRCQKVYYPGGGIPGVGYTFICDHCREPITLNPKPMI